MAGRGRNTKIHKKRMLYLRAKLLEQRRKLLHALDRGVEGDRESRTSPGDEYDAANDSSEKETRYGIAEMEATCLNEVEHALKKIEDGTYGQCERCGDHIPAGRLNVVPFATLCIKCKEREERAHTRQNASEMTWSRLRIDPEQSGGFDQVIDAISRGD